MKQTLLFLLAAAAVQAAPIFFVGQFGTTATVDNQSRVGDDLTFTVFNTSPTGVITGIGFDLPGENPNTFLLNSATNLNFSILHDVIASGVSVTVDPTFDVALLTGNTFGGGNPPSGIPAGTNATFSIHGPWGSLTADQIVQTMSIRFQSVGAQGELSTVAEPDGPSDVTVPEPMTSALLGGGLLAIGLLARRKRA